MPCVGSRVITLSSALVSRAHSEVATNGSCKADGALVSLCLPSQVLHPVSESYVQEQAPRRAPAADAVEECRTDEVRTRKASWQSFGTNFLTRAKETFWCRTLSVWVLNACLALPDHLQPHLTCTQATVRGFHSCLVTESP